MIDKSNLLLHEKIENVKKYQDCLGNTFYYTYEIMIDNNGNVLLEKTTDTIVKSNFEPKIERLVEINDNTVIHQIILEVYKEILTATYDLLQEPLEEQLTRIVNLKKTDPLLVKLFQDELDQYHNKMCNYKRQSELSKELLKTYQTKIEQLKQIIEANKNTHSDEIQKLMETISNVYRHL